MLRIGANTKLVAGAPGVAVTFGEKGRVLHTCDLPLYEFDALVDAMIKQRDDAHAFFARAGVVVGPPSPTSAPAARKRYSPPKIRLVPPSDPRAEELMSSLPTPMIPPPFEKKS